MNRLVMGVLQASSLPSALNIDLLGIIPPSTLMDYDKKLHYVIAVDDAFLFKKNLMKP